MITVFLGPSLPVGEAQELLPDARFLPPVQQGDVLRALDPASFAERTTTIAIIDGFFELVPAVWHKEILLALEQGVGVYGASSMGALRGAELHRFGMVGVGQIFEWFRDGVLEDDDEVAVTHGPGESGWRSLSNAMVDLRHAYASAADAGVITPDLATALVAIGKDLFYPHRSHLEVLDRAGDRGLPADVLAALRSWLGPSPRSLKADDARLLLRGLAEGSLPASPPARVAHVEETVFLDHLRTEVAQALGEDSIEGLEAGAARVGETPDVLRKKAALRFFARREADRLGLKVSEAELAEAAETFRRNSGLWRSDQTARWMETEGITAEAWVDFLTDMVLIEKLQRFHARVLERLTADHARLSTGKLHGTPTPDEVPAP